MKPIILSILALVIATSAVADNIAFADLRVKYYCVKNWDADKDRELSMEEAASVTSLGYVFTDEAIISSFDELQYFTGLTSIEDNAFYGCKALENITIPEGVTAIGKNAFYDCSALKTLSLPSTVETIGDFAYCGCWSIDNIILPEGVTSIGEYSFYNCSSSNSIFIPSTLKTIGSAAFWNCPSITAVSVAPSNRVYDSRDDCDAIIRKASNALIFGCQSTLIPTSIQKIGNAAFLGCSNLTGIIIPENIVEIGSSAFANCTELSSIDIPATVTTIGQTAFSNCSSLTKVILHEGLTTLGAEAFKNCKALEKISIPASVTKLQKATFQNCDNLIKVDVNLSTPLTIESNVFTSRRNASLFVPEGAKAAYKRAEIWTDFKNIYEKKGEHVSVSLTPDSILPFRSTRLTLALTNDNFNIFDGFEFNFSLPDGFSLDIEEGETLSALSSRFGGTDVTAYLHQNDEGGYHLTCMAPAGVVITGNVGDILSIPIKGNGEAMPGEYEVKVQEFTLHTTDDIILPLDDASCMLNVADYPLGDVNHDGEVGVADVMLVVNYVLDYESSAVFYIENADVNGDGSVGVSDVMGIVNIVLGL